MREVLQVRYGEIFLKGLNRPTFLRMLVDRVREAVKTTGGHVWLNDSRIYVSGMSDMEETIRLLRAKKPDCRVMVGGAVLNEEYARSIGADFYGRDAMSSVRYAESLFSA